MKILRLSSVITFGIWKWRFQNTVLWLNLSMLCNLTLLCRYLSIEIKVLGIKCLFKDTFGDRICFDIGQKLLWVTFDQKRPIWLVEFTMLLSFILYFLYSGVFGCWTVETEKQTQTIWKQMYLSANNINMIISGQTAIVRVWFVDPWTSNNTFHWLNWTPLVNLYALKITSRNSEK